MRYAVIDLETTGPKFDQGDRIFQFGCSIIEDKKIIATYDWLINPDRPIPKNVQDLTGIKNSQVKNQPYFEELGLMIYHLLSDVTLVAHNVGFDYSFLQQALDYYLDLSLDCPIIDTVELAQILLPQARSYRLSDLTQALGIDHPHAHSASWDAQATGHLFLYLLEVLEALPSQVIEQMQVYAGALIGQTGQVFLDAKGVKAQSKDYLQVGKLMIKALPTGIDNSIEVFDGELAYDYLVQKGKIVNQPLQRDLLISLRQEMGRPPFAHFFQAPTGSGKSLAYVLAGLEAVSRGETVWFACSNKLLQDQVFQEVILPLLKDLHVTTSCVNIKGRDNYLSLAAFANFLQDHPQADSKKLAISIMAILTWLTQTQTGDLSELNNTAFPPDMAYRLKAKGQGYSGFDYFQHTLNQVLQAKLIVTNHAFLMHHLVHLDMDPKPLLILDEVQALEGRLIQDYRKVLNFAVIQDLVSNWTDFHLDNHLGLSPQADHASKFINRTLLEIADLLDQIRLETGCQSDQELTKLWPKDQWLATSQHGFLQRIRRNLESLMSYFFKVPDFGLLGQESATKVTQMLGDFSRIYSDKHQWLGVEWTFDQSLASLSLVAYGDIRQAWDVLSQASKGLIGLSATLPTFSPLFLTLEDQAVSHRFDWDDTSRPALLPTYLPLDLQDIRTMSDRDYCLQVVTAIEKIQAARGGRTLVLVHSQKALDLIRELLEERGLGHGSLLFQSRGQASRKLQRAFMEEDQVTLFGLAQFWEGFDIGDKAIDQLVLTKLPFADPTSPSQVYLQALLAPTKRRYFEDYALPMMINQLIQGIGRLRNQGLKNPQSVWILDARLDKASYGPVIEQGLGPVTKLVKMDLEACLEQASGKYEGIASILPNK